MPVLYAMGMLLHRFFRAVWQGLKHPETRGVVYLVITLLITGTLVYHFVEGWRWVDAFYFSVITLTTVGYGDFSPKTDVGKLFTVFYILSGLGVLASFLSVIASHQQTSTTLLERVTTRGNNSTEQTTEG
ncbi:MAG: hypothetical protein OHK0046_31860 [Anaerolineae bacterium]